MDNFYQRRLLSKEDKEVLDENGVIKSCTNCKITKTPLWRVGPTGPKSLCNACGIKYRKRKDGFMGLIKDRYKEKYQRRNKINTTISCIHNDVVLVDVKRREDAKLREEVRAIRAKMLATSKDEKKCENKTKSSGDESGGGEIGEKLKVRVMELGKELVVLHRKPRSPTKTRRRRRIDTKKLGEVEEAAGVLMAMSCG